MKQILVLLPLLTITFCSSALGRIPLSLWRGGDDAPPAYLPIADVMPEPVGGLPAIAKHLVYPTIAKAGHIEGKVYLVAYINEKGDVDDVKIIKGLPGGCDDAAINAVKETKFSPGKQNGQPAKVQLSIPITFRLQ